MSSKIQNSLGGSSRKAWLKITTLVILFPFSLPCNVITLYHLCLIFGILFLLLFLVAPSTVVVFLNFNLLLAITIIKAMQKSITNRSKEIKSDNLCHSFLRAITLWRNREKIGNLILHHFFSLAFWVN